ncbi:hypothetical protein HB770_10960 [Rhizobium leguminosarum bv. viciae]|uniref:Uncharacterized protein n=3 Tax=Rhizobium leguminosarum TaxID=384 RepID=A0A7G6RJ95_RHILV|nr:hypothetical protein HB770_10960 [Rhizobium leguminosarum bv. viciae]
MQLGLFDTLRSKPIRLPVAPHGSVLLAASDPDFTFRLPHPRMVWDRAEIEVHRHEDGMWMWSASFMADSEGSSYRVGPKWGKFAETREDALFFAVEELEARIGKKAGSDAALILKWLNALKDNPEAFK